MGIASSSGCKPARLLRSGDAAKSLVVLAVVAASPSPTWVWAETAKCPLDAEVATPAGWRGWDRSSVAVWEAIEAAGGVVPEIEEDRSQSPPAWWRYPSAIRSASLLGSEAMDARWGLYSRVPPRELAKGDIVIRAGLGACGKMALVRGLADGKWETTEGDANGGTEAVVNVGNPTFFAADGRMPLADSRIFRIRIKKEDTVGHLRELRRDLEHLERTVGDRPPMLAAGDAALDVVSEKLHDLVDEAWSLVADETYDIDRRALAARAFALGTAIGWPGASEAGSAVIDDVLQRDSKRVDAWVTQGTLLALAGDAGRALSDARVAIDLASSSVSMSLAPSASTSTVTQARWLEVRTLLEVGGSRAQGEEALRRFLITAPTDRRAMRLEARLRASTNASASTGKADASPRAAPQAIVAAPAESNAAVSYFASTERAGLENKSLGFRITWPMTWRIVQITASPETGVLASFSTGRVLLEDGRAERASAVLLAQKPESPAARAALLRDGLRKMFPSAKLKSLAPLVPASRRFHFRDPQPAGTRVGEVVTLQKQGVVYFLVLNASPAAYPKLGGPFASVVRSLSTALPVLQPASQSATPSPPPSSPTSN